MQKLMRGEICQKITNAVQYDDLEGLKSLIKQGVLPVELHCNNEAAFRIASSDGRLHIMKYLIGLEKTHGKIDIHALGDAAFRWAAYYGHIDVMKYLVSLKETHGEIPINNMRRSDIHMYALYYAAMGGHIQSVKYIESLGGYENDLSDNAHCLFCAAFYKDEWKVAWHFQDRIYQLDEQCYLEKHKRIGHWEKRCIVKKARLQQLILLEKLNIPEDLMRLVDEFLF